MTKLIKAKKINNKADRNKTKHPLYLGNVDWEKAGKIFEPDKKLILGRLSDGRKQFPYTSDILKLLAAGALIGLSVVFPALPMAIAPFVIDSKKYQRHRLNQTIKRLKKEKLVEIVEKDGSLLVKITEEGRVKALQYKIEEMKIDKPKFWDKKWRIVIFDIPEKYKRMRDIFRKRLKILGFFRLQESVWVHPFPCAKQVEFLRQIYNVDIDVRYIIADKIENPEDLCSYFGLD